MRKIKNIQVGGVTGSGRRIDMPVDVWAPDYASDDVFNASNITQARYQPNRGDPAPSSTWPDSTFKPNFDVTPKPPRGSGT